MTKALTLELLLQAAKPKTKKAFELPQGALYVKEWTLAEADEVLTLAAKSNELEDFDAKADANREWRSKVIIYSVCDANGLPTFDEENIEQYGNLPAEVASKLLAAAMSHNGIGTDEAADKPAE